jgi:hypothetical protein
MKRFSYTRIEDWNSGTDRNDWIDPFKPNSSIFQYANIASGLHALRLGESCKTGGSGPRITLRLSFVIAAEAAIQVSSYFFNRGSR